MNKRETAKPVRAIAPIAAAMAALLLAAPGASSNEIKAEIGQADLMATPLGLSFAGSKRPWGSSVVLENPAHAQATGAGPKKNLCHFDPVRFRPFNKGEVASGPFKTKVMRDKTLMQHPTFDLEAHSGLPANSGWYEFDIYLPQGKSTIRIVLDSNKEVAEEDEGNNVYTVDVDVKFPCGDSRPGNMILDAPEAGDGPDRKPKFGQRLRNRNAQ